MKSIIHLLAGSALALTMSTAAFAKDMVIGVSWSNFQEERWKTDEAAMKAAIEAAGDTYVSTDAQSSAAKQLSDIESLMAQGVDALIVLAQDTQAIIPAVQAAADENVPVIAYDRLIEDSRAFYLTFDNVEVGRMQARAVLAAAPKGNYVMIKGSPTDPNADFLRGGQQEVLQSAIDAGDITIVGEAYTDGWLPANAQRNMEQILTAEDNKVDAVVASNDGTAGGAVAALTAQGMEGIPVSGQDGDHAALNRVAKGTQTVSVWKEQGERQTHRYSLSSARPAAPPWPISRCNRSNSEDTMELQGNPCTSARQPRQRLSMLAGSARKICARASPVVLLPATKGSTSVA